MTDLCDTELTKQEILRCLPKPSDAVDAMLQGLREWDARPDCKVDMNTFGRRRDLICYGCAATATIYKAFPQRFPSPAKAVQPQLEPAVVEFEYAINALRLGSHTWLFEYYNLPKVEPTVDLPDTSTGNWRSRLEPYEQYRDQLIALGL